MLKLLFAAPHHGWLPLRLEAGSAAIEFVASDVPNNPVQCLLDAVATALEGRSTEVWWHLEPDGYYFAISSHPAGLQLQISMAEQSDEHRKREVLSVRGSKPAILLPIWQGLRQLEALKIGEPHWPSTDFSQLGPMGEALHAFADHDESDLQLPQ